MGTTLKEVKYIINNRTSYTGEYIEKWCRHQIKNITPFCWEAEEIIEKFWGRGSRFKPNATAYYFIVKNTNDGLNILRLRRDTAKSPK